MSLGSEHINYKELYEASLQMNQQLQAQLQQLQHQLHQLTKLLKGFKSERYIPAGDTQQSSLDLVFEQAAAATALADVQKITYIKTTKPAAEPIENKQPGRIFPAHLRRVEKIVEPDQDVSGCRKMGEEATETLDYIPGELIVNRTVRPKYVCPVAGQPGEVRIVIAAKPARVIERSIADAGLLTQLVIDKYVDHLPLNRQMERFKRSGLTLSDSTIADLVRQCCELMLPLGNALLKEMLTKDYWHGDETGIAVLDKSKKKDTHNGYFWVYQTGNAPLVYYDYQRGRGREGPASILKSFKGYLQTDGYVVYDEFDTWQDITVFNCMAHARRKFFDAQDNDIQRAQHALTEIRKLYDIEAYCKEQQFSYEQIREKREAEALPVLHALGEWMKKEYIKLPPKSVIAQALAYSIKRWNKLSMYATQGHLNIDNNPVERSIRTVAVGRKNWLFCGSHEAAKRAGLLYSLMATCKLNQVNPYDWLKYVLTHIADHPINKINELLPHNWMKLKQNMDQENMTP